MAKEESDTKLFTQKMREATRNIHDKSDKLVNVKLGISMSDNGVWAEGLLVFYEIFRFLEEAMDRHKDSLMGELALEGMNRTEAFEEDLEFYFGKDWKKSYEIREPVAEYLRHLQRIEDQNPYLLMAYVYHLYMGMFSGGQILRSKRKMTFSTPKQGKVPGEAVTDYGEHAIGILKTRLREAMNRVAEDLDEETRQGLMDESVNTFKLNNEIIKSVKGVDEIFYKKLLQLMAIVVIFIISCILLWKMLKH